MFKEEETHQKKILFYKKNFKKSQKKLIKLFIFLTVIIILNLTIFLLFYLSDEKILKNNSIDIKKLFENLSIKKDQLKIFEGKYTNLNKLLIDTYNKKISNFNFEAYIFFFNSSLLVSIFFFIIIILIFQKQKNIFAIFIKIISFLLIIIFLFSLLFLNIFGIIIFYFDNLLKLFLIFLFKKNEIKDLINTNLPLIGRFFKQFFFPKIEAIIESKKFIVTIKNFINLVIKNKIYIIVLKYIHIFFNWIKKINILSKNFLESNYILIKETIVYLTYSLFIFNQFLIWIFLYKYNKVKQSLKNTKKYKEKYNEY